MKKSTSGFTIVELLIVIIVIAILAAITIVVFNGLQARALNDQKAAMLNVAQKSIENFYAVNGRYPASDELKSEADLQQLGLHQTDVVPNGCPVNNGIPLGWVGSSTCGLIYIAHPNTDGSGFQCMKPTVCRHYYLSYWSKTDNAAVTVKNGQ